MSLPAIGAGVVPALALAALLGFRHGFDADHIAVVDGMTRARQLHRSYWSSRAVGLQFAFTATRIDVQPVNLATVEGLGRYLPLQVRMQHLLKTAPS